jgi:serine/threonine protein kinase
MAPEQFDGKPCPASDVYALGVIAFELLLGTAPTAGMPLFELLMVQREVRWPDLSTLRSDVSPAFQAHLQRATAHRSADRFEKASDFVDALEQSLTAPDLPGGQTETSEPGWLKANRTRVLGGAAAGLAALAIWLSTVVDPKTGHS